MASAIRLWGVGALCLIGACSDTGKGSPPVTTHVTATTGAPSTVQRPDVAKGFFEALASGDANVIETWAQPGSDAALYFEHLTGSDGLLGLTSPSTVITSGTSFDVCRSDVCTAYDQIITDPATGRLVTFAIDGVPLSGRISGPGLDTDVDDVHARATTAYLSNEGKLLVVINLTNSAAVSVDVFGFAAVFQSTGATRGVEAIGAWGPTTIESNSTRSLLVAFPSSRPEGRLAFTGLRSDGIDVKFDVTVPSPA